MSEIEIENLLEVVHSSERTYVIVTASYRKQQIGNCNFLNKIRCEKGIPITGYVYDSQSDSYLVDCADYFHLGYIPVSFVIKIKELDFWETKIPVPENVLEKYLTSLQKKELNNFKKMFNSDVYKIQLIQMIDPN